MKPFDWTFLGFIAGAICTLIISIFTIGTGEYRRGQIDYANGTVKVERVEHPDQTVTWEWKEGE